MSVETDRIDIIGNNEKQERSALEETGPASHETLHALPIWKGLNRKAIRAAVYCHQLFYDLDFRGGLIAEQHGKDLNLYSP